MSGIRIRSPLPVLAAPRSTPAVSVLLSGTFHLAALGVFLTASVRSVPDADDVRLIPVQPWIQPPVEFRNLPPRNPAETPRTTDKGDIKPVAPEEVVEQPDIRTDFRREVKPVEPDGPARMNQAGGPDTATRARAVGVAPHPDLVSPYDEAPVAIYAPEPKYPPIAQEAGIEGWVRLELVVTSEGRVREIKVKEGNVILADAAREMLATWRFRPGRWNGHPVTTRVLIPVHFTLH